MKPGSKVVILAAVEAMAVAVEILVVTTTSLLSMMD